MPPVTVTVAATWRMSRVELNAPHDPNGTIVGSGEVLLQEAEGAPAEASILHRRSTAPRAEEGPKTYGAMPSDQIYRVVGAVLTETVEIDGKPVSFAQVLDAMRAFFEKWRADDIANPTPGPGSPPPATLTEMPVPPPGAPPPGSEPKDPAPERANVPDPAPKIT